MHALDGGLVVGTLTVFLLIPAGVLMGSLVGIKLFGKLAGRAEK